MSEVDFLAHRANVPPDLAALVVLAANRLDVPLRTFRGENKTQRFCLERRRVIVAGRSHGYSWWTIGRALNRDHSSVITAHRRGVRAEA